MYLMRLHEPKRLGVIHTQYRPLKQQPLFHSAGKWFLDRDQGQGDWLISKAKLFVHVVKSVDTRDLKSLAFSVPVRTRPCTPILNVYLLSDIERMVPDLPFIWLQVGDQIDPVNSLCARWLLHRLSSGVDFYLSSVDRQHYLYNPV